MDALMSDLDQHIKEEESEDLPALEKVISIEESRDLSRSFRRTKMFIPTRSHPLAPDKPPFETAVGLMTAPIDHLGDLFRRFPKEWLDRWVWQQCFMDAGLQLYCNKIPGWEQWLGMQWLDSVLVFLLVFCHILTQGDQEYSCMEDVISTIMPEGDL